MALEGAADDLFGVAEAVDGSGIDPVNAQIERAMDRGDGFVVVLRPPCEIPVAAADGLRAKADRGELKVEVAQSTEGWRTGCRHNICLNARQVNRLQLLLPCIC
jgi:hypothetical protein